jgi:hypothetical protein
MIPKKRVVIVHWKNKPEDPFEVFSSLKNFCLSYHEYNYNTLSNYLSKGKIAYDNQYIRIERKLVILKPKTDPALATKRIIVPVVRKVLLEEADDTKKDIKFWLSKSPMDRLSAVTELISYSMKKPKRVDKTKIVKRKLKA